MEQSAQRLLIHGVAQGHARWGLVQVDLEEGVPSMAGRGGTR